MPPSSSHSCPPTLSYCCFSFSVYFYFSSSSFFVSFLSNSILSPYITGAVLGKTPSANQWRVVFFIAAGVYVAGSIVFCLLVQVKPVPSLNKDGGGSGGKDLDEGMDAALLRADEEEDEENRRTQHGEQHGERRYVPAGSLPSYGATPTTTLMNAASLTDAAHIQELGDAV